MFDGARAKVRRADGHVQNLEREFTLFLHGRTWLVEEVVDSVSGENHAIFRITKQFPEHWPLVLGEVYHNLRSALDHAIYDLTTMHSGKEMSRSEFPIFREEAAYDRKQGNDAVPGSGLYKIRGVHPDVQSLIRQMQPFETNRGKSSTEHSTLGLLHDLNVFDKHRTLHLCRRLASAMKSELLNDIHPISFAVAGTPQDGEVIARWKRPADQTSPPPDFEFTFVFEVGFDESIPALRSKPVLPATKACVQAVNTALDNLERVASAVRGTSSHQVS